MVKRLYIRAHTDYDSEFQVVPINVNEPIVFELKLGKFELIIDIKGFDGSEYHLRNSCYLQGDHKFLDGTSRSKDDNFDVRSTANLQFEVFFTPNHDINLSELVFGNDCPVPVRGVIPTTLLNTGLKLFNWFINDTVKGNLTIDTPYIYGLGINLFTFVTIAPKGLGPEKVKGKHGYNEGLGKQQKTEGLSIPDGLDERVRFFMKDKHCKKFTFRKGVRYQLLFESDLIKMADSAYAVSLPAWGLKTFDIDVTLYANDTLNNFNWVIKEGGHDGFKAGTVGLVVNFALVDEPKNRKPISDKAAETAAKDTAKDSKTESLLAKQEQALEAALQKDTAPTKESSQATQPSSTTNADEAKSLPSEHHESPVLFRKSAPVKGLEPLEDLHINDEVE